MSLQKDGLAVYKDTFCPIDEFFLLLVVGFLHDPRKPRNVDSMLEYEERLCGEHKRELKTKRGEDTHTNLC